MAEVKLQLGDSSIDDATRRLSNLSLVISKDRFFYSIAKGRQLLYVESIQLGTDGNSDFVQELTSIILDHPLLKPGFKFVSIGYDHPAFSFTPVSLYSAGFDQTYIESSLYIPAHSIIKRDTLSDANLFVQYACLRDLELFLQSTFPQARAAHFLSSLILASTKQLEGQESPNSIFLHIIGQRCYLIVYRGQNLILANHYNTRSANDIVYYTLMLYEQLLLKTDRDALIMSGDITKESLLYKQLYTFIRNIQIASVQLETTSELIYPQLAFGLLELQQCAS